MLRGSVVNGDCSSAKFGEFDRKEGCGLLEEGCRDVCCVAVVSIGSAPAQRLAASKRAVSEPEDAADGEFET